MSESSQVNPYLQRFLPLLNPWAQFDPTLWGKAKDPFGLEVDFTLAGGNNVPASGTVTASVTVPKDCLYFAWCGNKAVVSSTADVVVTLVPGLTAQLTDSSSNRQLFNTPPHIATVAELQLFVGEVGPAAFWVPRLVAGGTTLSVTLTALVATAFNVRWLIDGFKIFPFAAAAAQ